jgi:chromosome segregation ATPase
MRSTYTVALACTIAALLAAAPARADDKQAAREREMLRRLQRDNQGLARDKRQLEQEKEELTGKNQAITKDLKRSQALARSRRIELERAAKEKAELTARLEELEKRYQDLTTKHQATEESLRVSEALVKRFDAQLGEQREIIGRQAQAAQALEDKNTKLYQVAAELLERYRRVGVGDVLLKAEPFTGIKQVETDNVFNEYREKLDAQRSEPARKPQ